MKRYRVDIRPITPIHIGTGGEIGLLEYKVVRTKDQSSAEYFRFSIDKIMTRMDDQQKKEILEEIESKDLKRIIRYITKVVTAKDVHYRIPASPTFAEEYFAKKDNPENQLNVQEMYRDPSSFKPVIPGSSLKGALRTAVINRMGLNKEILNVPYKYYEKTLLNYDDARNDPFRTVRVTDCLFSENNNEIIGQVFNLKKDFAKMAIFQEQLMGELSGGDATGTCEISIEDHLQKIRQIVEYRGRRWRPLPIKIGVEDIIDACNDFYKKNLKDEYEKFYRNSSHLNLKKISEELNRLATSINGNGKECLVRLGRYSHIENVTIERHRKPYSRKYGTSRTVSEKCYPMGWVKLKFFEIDQG
ncbi:MAG: type III-A CRISPR-associated RAMP protein Csm5 [Deltaproteobacteria bacterium]|nr:type III-A CRISPR-associated RAMP protein Csm5 [Deltaproteobacteria bacterium]